MNYSRLALLARRAEMRRSLQNLIDSKDSLEDQFSDYAEHHQHLINTYKEILKIIELAKEHSEEIGISGLVREVEAMKEYMQSRSSGKTGESHWDKFIALNPEYTCNTTN